VPHRSGLKPLRRGIGLGVAGVAAVTAWLIRARARERAEVQRAWATLEPAAGPRERFRPELVQALPEPARRYFLHAIRVGTPLAEAVELEMGGTMRLRPGWPWLPLRARELLAPPRGFVWEATVGWLPLSFSGADCYREDAGSTRFRLFGLLPIVRAAGPDVSRSARGRLAGEAIWNPASLLPQRGVVWEPRDGGSARATLTVDGEPVRLTLAITPEGGLRSVMLERWGNQTETGRYAAIPFGVEVLEEGEFHGYTVPRRLRGGWWYGSERCFDFFHPEIRRVQFR